MNPDRTSGRNQANTPGPDSLVCPDRSSGERNLNVGHVCVPDGPPEFMKPSDSEPTSVLRPLSSRTASRPTCVICSHLYRGRVHLPVGYSYRSHYRGGVGGYCSHLSDRFRLSSAATYDGQGKGTRTRSEELPSVDAPSTPLDGNHITALLRAFLSFSNSVPKRGLDERSQAWRMEAEDAANVAVDANTGRLHWTRGEAVDVMNTIAVHAHTSHNLVQSPYLVVPGTSYLHIASSRIPIGPSGAERRIDAPPSRFSSRPCLRGPSPHHQGFGADGVTSTGLHLPGDVPDASWAQIAAQEQRAPSSHTITVRAPFPSFLESAPL
ncbi:hypothetical protein C8Q74DRAFT_1388132 [Fomes fomentarius]|nr:hypothetical protein C8Q74DRAFT_1388132 [Fomes fomentarius]